MKEKNKQPSAPRLHTSWVPIPVALVIAALGICFIAFSSVIEYLAYAIGIFVIIGAAALGTATIMGKRYDFLFFIKLAFAVCCLATGILAILFNEYSAGIICIVFSSAVAIDGSVKLGTAIQSNQYSVRGKTVAAVIAVLTIAVALAMVRFTPYDMTDANIRRCSVIIGLSFILDAAGNFIIPFLKTGINRRIVEAVVDGITDTPADACTASDGADNSIPSLKSDAAPSSENDASSEESTDSNEGEESPADSGDESESTDAAPAPVQDFEAESDFIPEGENAAE